MSDPTRTEWQPACGATGIETSEDLLMQVAKGDEAAFERLYAAVATPMFQVIHRLLRNVAQSEEVTQEALIDLWRTASRYQPERGTALNWALTLARRRAVDRIRSVQARTNRDQRLAARSIERDFDQVVDVMISRWERDQVGRSLSLLTDVQRQSVMLAYYGGYTYAEVAEMLGVPLGTVKTRIRDGLIRLREGWEEPDKH
jgi:RNA polymerase sigma-70 factor (ECF subfamily)